MLSMGQRMRWWGVVLVLGWRLGHLPVTETVQAAGGTGTEAGGEEQSEVYVGLFMLGNSPGNRAFRLEGDPYSNTSVNGGLGGGLKVGVFPAFTGRVVGLEGEFTGFNGNVDAPQSTSGGITRSASFRLNIFNAMANLLVRYPGELFQPYVGAGIGVSGGFARDLNLQHSVIGAINENAGDASFAYQFIGGARLKMGESFFLFSEYKYFVANYKWGSELPDGSNGPSFSLPFRTHILSGGVGVQF